VLVLHAAKLANGDAFARRSQLFVADIFFLAGFTAFGSCLMGCGYGAVLDNVLLGFFVGLRCYRKRSCLRNKYKG
jgi:hypothetical protein